MTVPAPHPGPFAGLRVVEFGRFIAAPYCAQLLADGGADVIKVEPLDGDDARRNGTRISGTEARQFLNKNRGKRAIAADLSNPDVLSAICRLCERADVVIVNFRPGQARKLGLQYEPLARANPRLIYAANTGYGSQGPLAGAPGMDMVLQGYSGLAHAGERGPEALMDPIIDYTAALLMSFGIATALYQRAQSGRGQQLEVSLLQAALMLQNNHINHIDAIDGWRHEFADYLKEAFARGDSWADVLERRRRLAGSRLTQSYYGFFRTRDGVIALAGGSRLLQQKICDVLGFDDPWVRDTQWKPDDAEAHAERILGETTARIGARTTEDVLQALDRAGVPAGRVQFKEQLVDDPQALANGYFVRLQHETVGGMTVVGPPLSLSETPFRADRPPPVLGRHSRQILREAGLADTRIDELAAARAVRCADGGD
jgi:crotonobetainyl-CoA:carnitine CoA-transferase CaiB-like acyl-CoA transferase